jgi:hypothetical protein
VPATPHRKQWLQLKKRRAMCAKVSGCSFWFSRALVHFSIFLLGAVADDDKHNFETSAEIEVVTRFEDMGLKEDLLRGIYAYGLLCCDVVVSSTEL